MNHDFIIRARQVFTAVSDDVIRDGVVVVEGSRIHAVGKAADFGSRADGAPVVDTLLPGFVDSHAHPTLPSDGRPLAAQAEAGPELAALTAAVQLRRHLASGYTTVVDCGAKGETGFALKAASRMGLIGGPRLRVVGRPITPTSGHMSWCGSTADSVSDVRREVYILASKGADAIKVIASGGGTGGIPSRPAYDVESLTALAAAAHDQGLRAVAHCRATTAIERSVQAGIDILAHLEFIEPGALQDLGGGAPTSIPRYDPRVGQAVARSDAYLDLNPHSSGWDTVLRLRAEAAERNPSAAEVATLRGLELYFEAMLGVIRELAGLGLVDRMTFGSDAGPFDTEFGHPEYNVDLARQAGLSAAQSIQVITRNAAASIGLESEVGTIEAGKRADLVMLARDPLADARAIASPQCVVLDGKVVAGSLN